ncbi:MAG: excinuclease ABC subunit UvrC [Clostridiales bacterium]|nr:excinuclease ABC subunit UvrC [Clostridiales bacterium]
MNEVIKQKLENITERSGVYIMKDNSGAVIYVGKAKNLKNRVSQYFHNSQKLPKVQAMVEHIADFEYFITLSEQDAFALENNLIKQHQPFYNILLKDAKTFAYIKINLKEDYPRFEITRKLKNDGAKYFGPYINGISARDIMNLLNLAFPVRKCKEKLGKKRARACLNYSIGLCMAPCMAYINKLDYRKIVDDAIEFLKGNDQNIEKIITTKMQGYAASENFEKALEMRDNLKLIKKLKEKVVANIPKDISFDVFSYVTDGDAGAVCVITLRMGKILGVQDFSITDGSISNSETLQNFIIAYYKNKHLPDEILVNLDMENINEFGDYLQTIFNKRTTIFVPKIAIKSNLITMAEENAREHLFKRVREDKLKFRRTLGALINLKEILNLKTIPKRMECYDISNISGTNKVASMVVFENGEPAKKMYRKFKIKTVEGSNDFASLEETLMRRLQELDKSEDESFSRKPDLIVIDGGKGQLSSTYEVLKKSGHGSIKMISLAKRFEEVYTPNCSVPIMLKRSSEELKLLQRIRDEAHRFAITFHRNLRNKMEYHDPLDEVEGIGKVKKRALYSQFKTLQNIKNASVEELSMVKGINKNDAIKLKQFFTKDQTNE